MQIMIFLFRVDGELFVFRNKTLLDLNTLILPQTHDVVEETAFDLWANEDFIGYVTADGLAFHVSHSISIVFF